MTEPRPVPVVFGTAGHIAHGKSSLVRALPGVDPDRWEEEKRRGITIDLGYAQVDGEGVEVGFVDVPGHEKLVRKMVAGATGMGAALLVVSCDDGVMPQTREHFDVLETFGIHQGFIVLTKADLADEDTRLLVLADVEELVAGTSWESNEVVFASSENGEGIPEVRAKVLELAESIQKRASTQDAFRLPIQRAFSLHGAGTVVTGVTESGFLNEGEEIEVRPGGKRSRVRRIQVHGRESSQVGSGLRTALNLPDVEPQDCNRGVVVCHPASMREGKLLRVWLTPLAGTPPLEHGAEVQVLSGTASMSGQVWLPPHASDAPNGPWLVDLELEEPVAFVPGARVLLRRPSPACNWAAGDFLTYGSFRLRKRDQKLREQLLSLKECLAEEDARLLALVEVEGESVDVATAAELVGWTSEATKAALERLASRGEMRMVGSGQFVAAGRVGALGSAVGAAVVGWRRKHPHRLRIPIAELRTRLGKKSAKALDALDEEDLKLVGLARLPGTEWGLLDVELEPELKKMADQVLDRIQQGGLMVPRVSELSAELQLNEEGIELVMQSLQDQGELIDVPGGLVHPRAAVEALRDGVVAQMQAGGLDIPKLRDEYGTTRKYLMPLLEYFDACGVTERRGGNRILRNPEARV